MLDEIKWSITGNNVIYAISADTKNKDLSRQVDWTEPGYDTLRVSENNGECIAYDSLVVKVAPHTHPDFYANSTGKIATNFYNTTPNPIIIENGVNYSIPFSYFYWEFEDPSLNVQQSANSYTEGQPITTSYLNGFYNVTLRSVNEFCIDSATILVVNGKTAIAINSLSSATISLSPNPASTTFSVKASSETTSKGSLKLYNILGILVYEKALVSLQEVNETISVESLPEGIYSVVIETKVGIRSELLTVVR
jgi:hypothetical protein